ncbi:MAG: hypothetical protein JST68_15335 [Bacteroidetes bacterium]|nr:hypothetical protein [Bacteroidota bacterium]
MKALFSLLTLLVIVVAYVFSASFYLQGELIIAYTLVLSSITSLIFWIKSHDLVRAYVKNNKA